MVADGVGQGVVVVPRSGHIAVLDESVVKMATERFLHVRHILHLSDSSDAYLLPFIVVRHRFRCHFSGRFLQPPHSIRPRPWMKFSCRIPRLRPKPFKRPWTETRMRSEHIGPDGLELWHWPRRRSCCFLFDITSICQNLYSALITK